MDAIKGLKYALVLVLVVSAVLLGWTTYLERTQNRKIEQFAQSVVGAKDELEAKTIIRNFLVDTEKDPVANSASADITACQWLCE